MHILKLYPLLLAAVLLSAAAPPAEAQDRRDVVYLKNGSVVRGVIFEQVPGEYLRIETAAGNVFVFQMVEVERIEREPAGEVVAPGARPVGLERWYTYWALGWARPTYSGGMDAFTDNLERRADATLRFDLDLLGFYVPLTNHKTLVGGIINGGADAYSVGDVLFQVNQYLYGVSALHFVTRYIGRGPFVRADAGIARMVLTGTGSGTLDSAQGYGFLVGGGYGLQITAGTRLLMNANYSRRRIGGDTYGKLNVSIGGLF